MPECICRQAPGCCQQVLPAGAGATCSGRQPAYSSLVRHKVAASRSSLSKCWPYRARNLGPAVSDEVAGHSAQEKQRRYAHIRGKTPCTALPYERRL